MSAFWSGEVETFLGAGQEDIVRRLLAAQVQRFRVTEANSARAYRQSLELLAHALQLQPARAGWRVLLEYPLIRLGRRIDALLITERAILVFEFKIGAQRFEPADQRQVEDYALDLADFHEASRQAPIVPILIASDAPAAEPDWPLFWHGVTPVLPISGQALPTLLVRIIAALPELRRPLDPSAWEHAAYRPVPTIIEAANMLYQRHTVAEIASARADATNLTLTTEALMEEILRAREARHHVALFVTGTPGAGKTLCGLNAAFGAEVGEGATFLTGNPTLVHVLREALARDEAERGNTSLRLARRRMESRIQALPRFRDHYVGAVGESPAEHIAVIDEAQRSWSGAYAIRKSRDRPIQLSDSEPGHILDIMARHGDWAVLLCLIGSGQEIHDGEGGLAEWGEALARRPLWQVVAPPPAPAADRRHLLGTLPITRANPALHLRVPVRSFRSPLAAEWVDRVLEGDHAAAAALAHLAELPFRLTRSLAAMRETLRQSARGSRRAGLVASAGARRLRAEGLGAELPHMDVQAVCHWFLDYWPDVRASDALEVPASEFSCQGLELDYVGLCWGGDLIRRAHQTAWHVRLFSGKKWTEPQKPETIANQVNTYRVLLTRARYLTILWVPAGNPADPTNHPATFDTVAHFLTRCGVPPLQAEPPHPPPPQTDPAPFTLTA